MQSHGESSPRAPAGIAIGFEPRVTETHRRTGAQRPDRERLEQELVMYAHKMDVDEELDRLDSHLTRNHRHHRLQRTRRPALGLSHAGAESRSQYGSRRNRRNVETTRAAVDLKVLIEQMRAPKPQNPSLYKSNC